MIMMLLFSVVPAQAAPSAPSGQDPIPPAPYQDVPLGPAVNVNATAISSKYDHTCVITDSGGMKCWGDNTYGQLGDGNTGTNSNVPVDVIKFPDGPLSGVTGIAVGQYHTCAVVTGGIVYCWGLNLFGQLGNGNNADNPNPVQVTDLDGTSGIKTALSIGAGYKHTCAVIKNAGGMFDSTAKCWGLNDSGQLGNGTQIDSNIPVLVSGLTAVKKTFPAISGGQKHTCAIAGGVENVSCWGSNSDGQLGQDSTFTDPISTTPLLVKNIDGSGWPSAMGTISAGAYHNLAVSFAAAYAWGSNSNGQLGNNDATHVKQITPVNVKDLFGSNLTNVIATAAGEYHSCGVTNAGAVKCWGEGSGGQLGNGGSSDVDGAVTYGSISSGASKVAAGKLHTCVLMTNGSVTCAGTNTEGELGNGTNVTSSTPVKVTGLGPAPTSFSISGTITLNGSALAGVTVSGGGKTDITNDKGVYTLTDAAMGSVTVTPSKTGYTFTPTSLTFDLSADATGKNFTATAVSSTHSISGSVKLNGSGLAGVTVTAGSKTASTNPLGDYTLTGVAAGSVTVTPTMTGYTFTQSSLTFTLSADATGKDFTATPAASTYSISGTVKLNGSGLVGVTVTAASNGNGLVGDTVTAGSKTATTNSKGGYILSGLAAGPYTVTPTLSGYSFSPASLAVTISSSNVANQDFSASKSVTPGINSHFQGSMAGWNKVSAVGWKVNNNYLYSLDLGRNKYASALYSPLSFSNLDYSVRLMRTGCDGCATSIYVRGTGVSAFGNWTQGYQFSITRSGKYLVAKNVFAKLVPIQNWKASPYIVKNSGWNVLRVVASDTSLQFYINGHLVWSGTNSAFSSGKVGFGISSNSTGGVNRLYIDYATLTMP